LSGLLVSAAFRPATYSTTTIAEAGGGPQLNRASSKPSANPAI
jgi:hypothetical protein